MLSFEKIFPFIEKIKNTDLGSFTKSKLIIIYCLITSLITTGFAINSILIHEYTLSIILILCSSIVILNIVLLAKLRNILLSTYVFILTMGLTLLYLFFTGGVHGSGYIWYILAPIVSLTFLPTKKGNIISIILFLAAILIIFIPTNLLNQFPYEKHVIIRFIICYILVHIIFLIYLLINKNYIHEIEKTRENIEQESRIKDEFISKLSHQIRTPLNNIMVISDLVQETDISDNQRDLINTIVASTQNLVNIVNNIVKVTSIDIQEKKENRVKFDFYATIDNTLTLFRKSNQRDFIFEFDFQNKLYETYIGDPIRIKQIFINLIENIQKCKKNGTSTIIIDIKKINEDQKHHIFQCDISGDNLLEVMTDNKGNHYITLDEKEISENSLYYLDINIAKKIIEYYKGNIETKYENNKLTFLLTIFLEKASKLDKVKKVDYSTSTQHPTTKSKIDLKDANVLLVEDNQINQKIVLLSLKKLVKNIDVASNGKEALDKFGTSKYDLILMDIQMPIMNGYIATKKIRELELSSNTHTPIIAITANALAGDKENCLAAGMNDYLSKPFQIETLVQKMKTLLESSN